jgi:hypothetical protein
MGYDAWGYWCVVRKSYCWGGFGGWRVYEMRSFVMKNAILLYEYLYYWCLFVV